MTPKHNKTTIYLNASRDKKLKRIMRLPAHKKKKMSEFFAEWIDLVFERDILKKPKQNTVIKVEETDNEIINGSKNKK